MYRFSTFLLLASFTSFSSGAQSGAQYSVAQGKSDPAKSHAAVSRALVALTPTRSFSADRELIDRRVTGNSYDCLLYSYSSGSTGGKTTCVVHTTPGTAKPLGTVTQHKGIVVPTE